MFFNENNDNEKVRTHFDKLMAGIPNTGYEHRVLSRFSTDQKDVIISTHNLDIYYKFNEYGYRCENFIDRRQWVVLTLGCSIGFGNGIPAKERFSAAFCKKLTERTGSTVSDWNLSWPGTSGDYVARMVAQVVPILKPDVLLANMPYFPRREFFDCEGEIYAHRPDRKTDTRKDKELFSHSAGLTSDYQDAYNFYRNLKLIELIADQHKVKWLYSIKSEDLDRFNKVAAKCRLDNKVSPLVKSDYARDGGHPGVMSNYAHGIAYFAKYEELYGLAKTRDVPS